MPPRSSSHQAHSLVRRYSPWASMYASTPRGPGSGCSGPRRARRRRSCEAIPIGGMDTVGSAGPRGRGRASAPARPASIPGRLTTTSVASSGDPLGLPPVREVGQAVGADEEEQVVLGPLGGGPPPASRRCSAARAAGSRSRRPRRPGAPRWRSGPSPGGRPPAVRSPGLCGGAPATTNQTRSSPQRLAARLGQDQVPQVDRVERPAEQAQSHRSGVLLR